MALVSYTKNVQRLVPVSMGIPKKPGYTALIGTYNDSGFKTVPYQQERPFTRREASETAKLVGGYTGNVRAIPTVPYYGEGVAENFCIAFANGVGYESLSSTRIYYERGVTKNIALSRFVEEMMGDLSTSSLGVSVMEGRDALQMIKTRVGNLALTMINLRKGKLAKARKYFSASLQVGRYDTVQITKMRRKSAKYFNDLRHRIPSTRAYVVKGREVIADKGSSLWLEYWLGWAPMVADIDKLMDVLASSAAKLPTEGIILKSSAKRTLETTFSALDGYKKCSNIPVVLVHRHTITGRVSVQDPEKFLNRRAGLTNLPAIIYAGIPFSFILDWFIGIGKVLELTDSFTGIQWHSGCYSDTYTIDNVDESWSYREANGGQWTAWAHASSKCRIHRRYVLSAPPTGAIVPRFKDLTQIFEGKEHRAWTSVSLLTQFLISHRNSR